MGDVVSYFHIFSVGADFMDNTQVEHPETGSLFNPILPKNSRFVFGYNVISAYQAHLLIS